MNRPHLFHPVGTTRSPRGCVGTQGSQTDRKSEPRRTSFVQVDRKVRRRVTTHYEDWRVRRGIGSESFPLLCSWMFSNCKSSLNLSIQRLPGRVILRRAQYDESCKLCLGGSCCLSKASVLGWVSEAWEMVAYPVADVSGSSPLVSSPWSKPVHIVALYQIIGVDP